MSNSPKTEFPPVTFATVVDTVMKEQQQRKQSLRKRSQGSLKKMASQSLLKIKKTPQSIRKYTNKWKASKSRQQLVTKFTHTLEDDRAIPEEETRSEREIIDFKK